MTNFQIHFHRMMLNNYERAAKEIDYRPSYFLKLVTMHGGVNAAKFLLNNDHYAPGLTRLWELERLDLSMEALVIKREWKSLFSNKEVKTATKRLEQLGYNFGQD